MLAQGTEDESAIGLDTADPLHVVLRIVDVEALGIALAVRDRRQRAIRPKDPGVVWTAEQPARALVHHAKARAAVRTAVLQNVDFSVLMAGHQDLVRCQPGADEIPRIFELAFVGEIDPKPTEDPLLLEREDGRIGIGAAMHVVRTHEAADVVRRQRHVK